MQSASNGLRRSITTARMWGVLLLLVATTSTGCATRVGGHDIKSAKVSWKRAYRLAILGFDGKYGETVRECVLDKLAQALHFEPVNTSPDVLLTPAMWKDICQHNLEFVRGDIKADSAVAGRVTVAIHDDSGTDQILVKEGAGCYKKEKNVNGQWVDVEIKRTLVRPRPYVIRKAFLSTDYKVVDLNTLKIVAEGNVSASSAEKYGGSNGHAAFDKRLSDLPRPSVTVEELADKLAIKLVEELNSVNTFRRDNNDR